MKKAKVDVSKVQGIGKKMHEGGSIVSEKDFPKGVFEKLIKERRILELKPTKAEAEAKAKAEAEPKKQNTPKK